MARPEPVPLTDEATGFLVLEPFDPRSTVGDSFPSTFCVELDVRDFSSRTVESGRSLIEFGSEIGINTGSTIYGAFPERYFHAIEDSSAKSFRREKRCMQSHRVQRII